MNTNLDTKFESITEVRNSALYGLAFLRLANIKILKKINQSILHNIGNIALGLVAMGMILSYACNIFNNAMDRLNAIQELKKIGETI
jgi:hypothetical protein